MQRTIDAFHQDDFGEWVAELSCLHNQHVRHRPPFQNRPWVTTPDGRATHIGSTLDCPLCDRAELPDGLALVRTAGPFDADTLPPGLRRDHRVAERTWGVLRVLEGAVRVTMHTDPPLDRTLYAGDRQPIPPGVPHAVDLTGPARVAVDFLTRAPASRDQ
jgi:tellurite methyltransferase